MLDDATPPHDGLCRAAPEGDPAPGPVARPPSGAEARLHAMKNQLAVIGAGLALLERAIAPEQRERMRAVRAAADELDRLVRADLAPGGRPAGAPVDLADLAREARAAFAPLAAARGVTLECDAAPCAVVADRGALAEALGNLVLNAIEATPPAGRVRIEAGPAAGGAELAVADTGPGMSREMLARLERGRFSTRPGGGLGLAIARRRADEQGGSLRLESAPGAGTRATLALGRPPRAP